jgi:hypothetical protein
MDGMAIKTVEIKNQFASAMIGLVFMLMLFSRAIPVSSSPQGGLTSAYPPLADQSGGLRLWRTRPTVCRFSACS